MAKKISDDHHLGALIEDTNDKVSGLVEVVSIMNGKLTEHSRKFEIIEEQTSLIKPMYDAIKDQGKLLKDHERRITAIEQPNT